MGNIGSNPLDEAKQARMQEIINQFAQSFSEIFPLKYTEALVEKIKDDRQPEESDERQLPDAPVPDYELKRGNITKVDSLIPFNFNIQQCAFRKNWKVNFFVAYNKADNFRIDYSEKENGPVKGSINCCGYSAEAITEDHYAAPFGIQIKPSNETRRTYFLKFETKEEQEEWLLVILFCDCFDSQIIKNACDKAEPPKTDDVVISKAFKAAYRALRWRYGSIIIIIYIFKYTLGYYGWYHIDLSEPEQLADLCAKLVYRELIQVT